MTTAEWMGVVGAGLVGAATGSGGSWYTVAFCTIGAIGGALIVMAIGRAGK